MISLLLQNNAGKHNGTHHHEGRDSPPPGTLPLQAHGVFIPVEEEVGIFSLQQLIYIDTFSEINCSQTFFLNSYLMTLMHKRNDFSCVGMCGNPKVGSGSVLEKPNRSRKVKTESGVSVVFCKNRN
jgi:hypothetical protein